MANQLTTILREMAGEFVEKIPGNWQVTQSRDGRLFVEAPFLDPILHNHDITNLPTTDNEKQFVECTHYLDLQKRVSYSGNLFVSTNLEGQGIGRRLVELREEFCKKLGIEKIVISTCTNHSFWEHMGYTRINQDCDYLGLEDPEHMGDYEKVLQ